MKFKDFLNEERTTNLDIQDAAKEYLKNYSNTSLDDVFIRGTNNTGNFYINDPKKSDRKSISGNYISMYILDDMIAEKFNTNIKRKNSVIMATQSSTDHIKKFGKNAFYVIPKNNSKLLYVEGQDFNYYKIVKNMDRTLSRIAGGKDIKSYKDALDLIESKYSSIFDSDDDRVFYRLFGFLRSDKGDSIKSFDDAFKHVFGKVLDETHLVTTASKVPNGKHEVWTDSECLLINITKFEEFKAEVERLRKE